MVVNVDNLEARLAFCKKLPTPVAESYCTVLAGEGQLAGRVQAIFVTAMRVLQTVDLTLVSQYLIGSVPPGHTREAALLNDSVMRVFRPNYTAWIDLVRTVNKVSDGLGLDFFKEANDGELIDHLASSLGADGESHVAPAPGAGSEAGVTWLTAFTKLRNAYVHYYDQNNEELMAQLLGHYLPILNDFLDAFAWIADYQLVAVHCADGAKRLTALRGPAPSTESAPLAAGSTLNAVEQAACLAAETTAVKSSVVMLAPDGRALPVYPLFAVDLAPNAPLGVYNGHELTKQHARIAYSAATEIAYLDVDMKPSASAQSPEAGLLTLIQQLEDLRHPLSAPPSEIDSGSVHSTARIKTRALLTQMVSQRQYVRSDYVARPAAVDGLHTFLTSSDKRTLLLSGAAGSGKTVLLCKTIDELAADDREPIVIFVRGRSARGLGDGRSLLLDSILEAAGLDAGTFRDFAAFLGQLETNRAKDNYAGDGPRPMIVIIDALDRVGRLAPSEVFAELCDLARDAAQFSWVHLIASTRSSLLWLRTPEDFDAQASALFFTNGEKPAGATPDWPLPPSTDAEAEAIYTTYKQLRNREEVCPADWNQLARPTRDLLHLPLFVKIWHRISAGHSPRPITTDAELLEAYRADIVQRDADLWYKDLSLILDRMMRKGRTELRSKDIAKLAEKYREAFPNKTLTLVSPMEVAVTAGVMVERVDDGESHYGFPYCRVLDALLYDRLFERDDRFSPKSCAKWLTFPRTLEFISAMALVARDLWDSSRSAELAQWFSESEVGVAACTIMFIRAIRDWTPAAADKFVVRQEALQQAVKDENVSRLVNCMRNAAAAARTACPEAVEGREAFLATLQAWRPAE